VDVHKQIPGRNRHWLVDVLGLVLLVVVHSASVQDAAGGYQTLQKMFELIKGSLHNRWRGLKLIWADGAYVSIVKTVHQQVRDFGRGVKLTGLFPSPGRKLADQIVIRIADHIQAVDAARTHVQFWIGEILQRILQTSIALLGLI